MKPLDRQYWRSLEGLADDPQAREFFEREFPEGASEPPEGVNRRTMLGLLGATLSLAGLTACRRPAEKIVPFVEAPEDLLPGVPRHYATTMPFGTSAYGLIVESHEGRPTKVEGNPRHPATRGRSSSWMQASVYGLYDPDRGQAPRNAGQQADWDGFGAAWATLREGHAADGGAGLAVVSESYSSPSFHAAREAFRSAFPSARWAVYEPVSDENERGGIRAATGRDLRATYDFSKAKVVLSLDRDFLLGDPEATVHAAGFAAARDVSDGMAMNRLYAVEAAHTVTGANADHRIRLASGQIPGLVAALASALNADLGLRASDAPAPAGIDGATVQAIARDLAAHQGECLIVAGRRQPIAVHAAVHALNRALGNAGKTVTYREPIESASSKLADLSAVVDAMRSGTISTLVVLGGNPVYDAPADLDFGGALGQVSTVIHHADAPNETSAASGWYLPRAHFLESWGDARSADGTASVIQPLILPLYDSRSDLEFVRLLTTGEATPGYDLVRDTWAGRISGDFEAGWARLLHDGLLLDSAGPGRSTPAPAATPSADCRQAAAGPRSSSAPRPRSGTDGSPTAAGSRSCRTR